MASPFYCTVHKSNALSALMRDNQNQTRNQVTWTDLAPIAIFAHNRADRIEGFLPRCSVVRSLKWWLVRIYMFGLKGLVDKDAVKAVCSVLRTFLLAIAPRQQKNIR